MRKENLKIVCVLYDDPVDGYPPKYARDGISVSFNLMLSSFAEKLSKPMWAAIGGR